MHCSMDGQPQRALPHAMPKKRRARGSEVCACVGVRRNCAGGGRGIRSASTWQHAGVGIATAATIRERRWHRHQHAWVGANNGAVSSSTLLMVRLGARFHEVCCAKWLTGIMQCKERGEGKTYGLQQVQEMGCHSHHDATTERHMHKFAWKSSTQ